MSEQHESPDCFFSLEQYEAWKELIAMAPISRHGYCSDCLPCYKRQMMREGRCAHVGVRFHVDAEGFIEGRRPIGDKDDN